MLTFDKAAYLSLLFKFILSVRLSNEDQRFFIFIIHRYSIHFCIIVLLNLLYWYILF